jgi:hypothetical protein
MDVGVFIPIGNNGWIISATSPQGVVRVTAFVDA